ncbi:MAG: GNAT family N-acetyltransferase [Candidatus Omnitrophica bacterium]|nr:GNAT family N-acetyltransferase [Candidatus Omnitrophota bacterium]
MKFEILNPQKHNRDDFDCGVDALNRYLKKFANQDQKRSLTKVYVLAKEETIIGFYSISAHSVLRDHLPENQKIGPYEALPFLLLGRLAVDKRFQGRGYGDVLIYHAFEKTLHAAETVGIMGMVVDAKNEKAAAFYEGFGFKRLAGAKNRLALPMAAIKKAVHK